MSEQQDRDNAELERANEELTESLARCRFMLADAQAKLTANINEEMERQSKAEMRTQDE